MKTAALLTFAMVSVFGCTSKTKAVGATPTDAGVDTGAETGVDGGPDLSFSPLHFPQVAPDPLGGPLVGVDASGNVILAFTLNQPSEITPRTFGNTGGGDDIAVAKLDAKGKPQWVMVFGGSGDERVASLAVDAAGNAYLGGSFSSNFWALGTTTLPKVGTGSGDAFVLKLDPGGTPLSAIDVTAAGEPGGSCDRIDVRGQSVLVACTVEGAATLPLDKPGDAGPDLLIPPPGGGKNVLAARLLDANLKAVWGNAIGGPGDDFATGAAFSPDGSVLAVSLRFASGPVKGGAIDVATPGAGTLLARLNPAAGLSGVQAVIPDSGGASLMVADLSITAQDIMVAAGSLIGTLTLDGITATSGGDKDAVVAGFSAQTGKASFARVVGGAGDQTAQAIALDPSGAITIAVDYTGSLQVDGTTLTAPSGATAAAVFELPLVPGTDPVWAREVVPEAPHVARPTGVALAGSSGVLHAGVFRGTVDLGDGKKVSSFSPTAGWNGYLVALAR